MPSLAELRLFVDYHLRRRVHDHPARDTALGVVSLGYTPDAYAASIDALREAFDVEVALVARYGGREHPVFRVSSRSPHARRRLTVLGGVHGNEEAGILALPPLLARLARDPARLARVALDVLTPVNAVGAAEGSRFNADGFDVNRDFVRFETAEARAVRDLVTARRPDLLVSLHEGPQDAAFFFANEHVPAALSRRLLDALEAGGTALARVDYLGRTLHPPGLSAASPASIAVVKLWAATLGMRATNGWAAALGVPEITLESGWRSPDRDARLRAHEDLVLAALDALAD